MFPQATTLGYRGFLRIFVGIGDVRLGGEKKTTHGNNTPLTGMDDLRPPPSASIGPTTNRAKRWWANLGILPPPESAGICQELRHPNTSGIRDRDPGLPQIFPCFTFLLRFGVPDGNVTRSVDKYDSRLVLGVSGAHHDTSDTDTVHITRPFFANASHLNFSFVVASLGIYSYHDAKSRLLAPTLLHGPSLSLCISRLDDFILKRMLYLLPQMHRSLRDQERGKRCSRNGQAKHGKRNDEVDHGRYLASTNAEGDTRAQGLE